MAIWHDLGGPGRVCKCAAGPVPAANRRRAAVAYV